MDLQETAVTGRADTPEYLPQTTDTCRPRLFFPALLCLACMFVMATFRAGPPTKATSWARRLVYLWLTQNVFLVASAGWRLSMYIEAYSLTRWRIAAMIWMALVACELIWIVVRIGTGWSNLWFLNASDLTALVVLFLCSFLNFDGWIGDFNVWHCREVTGQGPPIDLKYLQKLGYETLPGLIWLADRIKDTPQEVKVKEVIARLRQNLEKDTRDWQGRTFRRDRLKVGLTARE